MNCLVPYCYWYIQVKRTNSIDIRLHILHYLFMYLTCSQNNKAGKPDWYLIKLKERLSLVFIVGAILNKSTSAGQAVQMFHLSTFSSIKLHTKIFSQWTCSCVSCWHHCIQGTRHCQSKTTLVSDISQGILMYMQMSIVCFHTKEGRMLRPRIRIFVGQPDASNH
jgi:hypothetical protein